MLSHRSSVRTYPGAGSVNVVFDIVRKPPIWRYLQQVSIQNIRIGEKIFLNKDEKCATLRSCFKRSFTFVSADEMIDSDRQWKQVSGPRRPLLLIIVQFSMAYMSSLPSLLPPSLRRDRNRARGWSNVTGGLCVVKI